MLIERTKVQAQDKAKISQNYLESIVFSNERIDEILNREEERLLSGCKYSYQLSSIKIL